MGFRDAACPGPMPLGVPLPELASCTAGRATSAARSLSLQLIYTQLQAWSAHRARCSLELCTLLVDAGKAGLHLAVNKAA